MKRILCVEDDPDSCEMITVMLQTALKGVAVESAASAGETMRLTAAEPFDLYLIDYRMPDMDGVDLCRWLKERQPTTPVVFYSAGASAEERRAGLDAGADAYLIKPNDLHRVADEIATRLHDSDASAAA